MRSHRAAFGVLVVIATTITAACEPSPVAPTPVSPVEPTPVASAPTRDAPAPPVAVAAPDAGTVATARDAGAAPSAKPPSPPMPALPFASYESVCDAAADASAPMDLLMGSKPPAKRATARFVSKDLRAGPSSSSAGAIGFAAYVSVPEVGLRREVFRVPGFGDPYQCCTKGGASALTFTCSFGGISQIESRGTVTREGNSIVLRWCTANLSTKRVMDRGGASAPMDPKAVVTFASRKPECAPPLPQ